MRVCDDDDDDDGDGVCVCDIYISATWHISISMRSVDAVGRSVGRSPLSRRICVRVGARSPVVVDGWCVGRRRSRRSRCVGGGVSCRVVSCRRTCGSQRNELANDDDDDDDDDDGFFGFDEEEEDDDDEADDDDDDASSWTTRRRMRAPMR